MSSRTAVSMASLVGDTYANDIPRLPAPGAEHYDDDDIRHAHVALDRLRAHTANFATVLDAAWRDTITGELNWEAREVAPAHDLDVLHHVLAACATAMTAADALELEPLLVTLEAQRAAARERAAASLADERYATLCARLAAAATAPPVLERASAAEWVADSLALAWDRLAREVAALEAAPERSPDAAHDAAARARLAAEAAVPLRGEPASRLASALRGVQRVLGAQRGAAIAVAWVRAESALLGTDDAFAAGIVSGLLRNATNSARAEFPAAWAKAVRRKERMWS